MTSPDWHGSLSKPGTPPEAVASRKAMAPRMLLLHSGSGESTLARFQFLGPSGLKPTNITKGHAFWRL